MADNLDAYIRKAFDHYPKFATGTGKPLKTMNGAGQGFSYRQNLANNQTVTMYGDAFYEQHGGKLISIIVLLLPEEQYATVKDKAYEIVNSFTALPENYIPDGALDGDTAKPEANTSDTSNQSAFTIGDLTDYGFVESVIEAIWVPDGMPSPVTLWPR